MSVRNGLYGEYKLLSGKKKPKLILSWQRDVREPSRSIARSWFARSWDSSKTRCCLVQTFCLYHFVINNSTFCAMLMDVSRKNPPCTVSIETKRSRSAVGKDQAGQELKCALSPSPAFFFASSSSSPCRNSAAVKAILHSRDINVVRAGGSLTPGHSVTRSTLLHPRAAAVPQLLLVTSGGKQWRDVGHENGSAFVAGNCLSFCYFAASKSQTSAGVLGTSRLVPRRGYCRLLRRCPRTHVSSPLPRLTALIS